MKFSTKPNVSIDFLWYLVVLVSLLASVACQSNTIAQASGSGKATIPEITVEVNDNGLTVPQELPAGLVAITVKNTGANSSGLMFARLNEGVSLDTFKQALAKHADEEIALASWHGEEEVGPGSSLRVIHDLHEGHYVAISGPYEQPVVVQVEVNRSSSLVPAAPTAEFEVKMADFAYVMPHHVKAGVHLWSFENTGKEMHLFNIIKLHEGKTIDDVLALAQNEELPDELPFDFAGGWGGMSAGERAWAPLDLSPGEYMVICGILDAASGKRHMELGMFHPLVVTD